MKRQFRRSPVGKGECEGLPGECKWCSRCKEWWPLSLEFFSYHHTRRPRGWWSTWCRACHADARRESRERAKENR